MRTPSGSSRHGGYNERVPGSRAILQTGGGKMVSLLRSARCGTIATGQRDRGAPGRQRAVLGLASVVATVLAYTLVASAYGRPDVLPPTRAIVAALTSLVSGQAVLPPGGHVHPSDQIAHLLAQNVTLQGALVASTARVLFGLGVGGALGILAGFAMGWSRRADEYLRPLYVLARSIPD